MSSEDETELSCTYSQVWSFFPLPVKKVKCPLPLDHIKKHISTLYHIPGEHGTSYSASTDVLSDPALSDIRAWLIEQAIIFAADQMCVVTPIKMTQSWAFSLYPTNTSWRTPHTHPNCLLTGILYLEKEPDCGHLRIWRPKSVSNAIEMVVPKDFRLAIDNPWARDHVEIPATVGDLILIPSWASHSIDMKNTTQRRSSLCFDILYENVWGVDQYPPQQYGSTYFVTRDVSGKNPGDEIEQG